MNSQSHDPGFSFLELVVVIGILSVVLMFSFPLFHDRIKGQANALKISGLVRMIENLRQKAVLENKDFYLHVEPFSGRMHISDSAVFDGHAGNDEIIDFKLDPDISILGVEFKTGEDNSSEGVTIGFFKQDFADPALIHLRADGRDITVKIPVFLARAEVFLEYLTYDDCI